MSFVVDASIIVSNALPDESSDRADAVVRRIDAEGAEAPSFLPLEIANALLLAVRRKRIDDAGRRTALAAILSLDVKLDEETSMRAWSATADLAARHGLTAYDAAYLELAQRKSIPLATLDSRLADAARTAGVELL